MSVMWHKGLQGGIYKKVFTCEFGLVVGQSFEAVSERGEDAFQCAKHRAQSQIEQHEEEKSWPEGAARQAWHGLCEGDEG